MKLPLCIGICILLVAPPAVAQEAIPEFMGPVGFALQNGDVNGDLERDVSDGVYTLSNLFLGGPPAVPLAYCGGSPSHMQNGDMNDDGTIDISDPVRLFAWLFVGGSEPAPACGEGQGGARNTNPRVIPPNAKAFGKSYGEWSGEWWHWALSLPVDQNPFFDETGCQNGANGQSGHVWYLTGVISVSGTADRTCTVPAGKALFFPVLNLECSTVEAPPFHGGNYEELLACTNSFQLGNLEAEVDGVSISDLDRYIVSSPLTDVVLPENNSLGVPAGPAQIVGNGSYLMLAPLPVGEHLIHFTGTFTDFSFTLDITYHLTVTPGL